MGKDFENYTSSSEYDFAAAKHFDFVSKINNASVITRYPEDFKKLISSYPREVAKEYLEKTENILSWLKQHVKSI